MRIRELHILSFRGFSEFRVRPNGHVVIMGEPRAGRSGLIAALGRVLDSSAFTIRSITELDFYHCNTDRPIFIGLILGESWSGNRTGFHRQLSNCGTGDEAELVDEAEAPEDIDNEKYEWVLRLAYHCEMAAWRGALSTIGYSIPRSPTPVRIPLLVLGEVTSENWDTARSTGAGREFLILDLAAGFGV